MTDTDLLAPPVASLVQLFSAQPALKFPDLDAPALQDAVARVKERHLELVRAEAQALAAKAALDDEQEQLLKLAHRAQAYLRVFAESDAALAEKVNALTLPRLRKPRSEVPVEPLGPDAPPPRKRGRPRKVRPDEASLFAAPSEEGAAAQTM